MEWRPIETAPGPLVNVLIYDADARDPEYAYFIAWREEDRWGGKWYNAHTADGEGVPEPIRPTHWMPLVPPSSLRSPTGEGE